MIFFFLALLWTQNQTTTNQSDVYLDAYYDNSNNSRNTHKLTTHHIVQLDGRKGFDFCFIQKLGPITEKHGLQEKGKSEIRTFYFPAAKTMLAKSKG